MYVISIKRKFNEICKYKTYAKALEFLVKSRDLELVRHESDKDYELMVFGDRSGVITIRLNKASGEWKTEWSQYI